LLSLHFPAEFLRGSFFSIVRRSKMSWPFVLLTLKEIDTYIITFMPFKQKTPKA